MGERESRVWFFIFRFLIIVAAVASWFTRRWVSLILSVFLLAVILLQDRYSEKKYASPGILEVFILLFIFASVILPYLLYISGEKFWVEHFLRFVLSIIVVLAGFFLIFILNREKTSTMNLSPFFIALFSFCFSLAAALGWEIVKFLLDMYAGTNTQSFLTRIVMWEVIIYSLGAFLASALGYLHLKYFESSFLKKILLKFIARNRKLFVGLASPQDYVLELIRTGETERVEFKSSIRTNLYMNQHDKRIEHSLLKTIVAFLNTSGGTLLVGVSDDGRILGLEKDNFRSEDKMKLHIATLVKNHIGNNLASLIQAQVIHIDKKLVVKIECKKSQKQVFLNTGDSEEFYIRSGPSSVMLSGSKLVDYVSLRFRRR